MILAVHSDAGYCNKKKLRSQVGGHFFLSNDNKFPPNNGEILTIATIIKAVMSSAAEAELEALMTPGIKLIFQPVYRSMMNEFWPLVLIT